jgi:import receptor subunit TOM22
MAKSNSNSNRKRIEPPKSSPGSGDGVLSRLHHSLRHSAALLASKQAASQLLRRAGKAFWYFSTSFLVLAVPLIIELDREAQLVELESHQTTVLGAPSQPPPGFLMRV